MTFGNTAWTVERHSSCGFHLLNHLTADRTSLTGGELTVVAVPFFRFFVFSVLLIRFAPVLLYVFSACVYVFISSKVLY